MTISDAVDDIKREAASIAGTIRDEISELDFNLDSLNAVRDKYNLISQSVLGLNYDRLIVNRSLPPVNPDKLFDQKRIALVDITAIGDVFFPSVPTDNNLSALQELYINLDEDLDRVSVELDNHPPVDPEASAFSATMNQFVVTTVASTNQAGLSRTRDEIAQELGRETFEFFLFTDVPQLYFVVFQQFEGLNTPLTALGRKLGLKTDQISVHVFWFGGINASSSNFAKMRISLDLTAPQIRVASFGDDLAVSSSSRFLELLDRMDAKFNFVSSSLQDSAKLAEILNAVLEDARTFLAQITFGTTVVQDSEVLDDLREGGATDPEIEFSFQRRDDPEFGGANLSANELSTTVFPTTDNQAEIRALGGAFQQDPDTFRYTNRSLNEPEDRRANVVLQAKKLVASIEARAIVIQKPLTTRVSRDQALLSVQSDLEALRSAYDEFLNPTGSQDRVPGTKTTESANNILTRATNLISSLRILDQIKEFPGDPNENLTEILSAIRSIAGSQNIYFSIYRSGVVRDFLAETISVSSVTNFLLADGDPSASQIVVEAPALIANLRESIQTTILDDEESEELYNSVSLQVEEFSAVLRGDAEDDPVGRLFDLPVTLIDSLLPLGFEDDQEQAFKQLRDSFAALRTARSATTRDLSSYASNFSCAFTDAKYLNARLAGDSISGLISELRQT